LTAIAAPSAAFFLLSPAQKQCFYTSKALLFECKLNAFKTQYQCYYNLCYWIKRERAWAI